MEDLYNRTEMSKLPHRRTERTVKEPHTRMEQSSVERSGKNIHEPVTSSYLSKQAKQSILKSNLARKTRVKDTRNYDIYNQNMMSDFHDHLSFKEESIKLDDREFIKNQKKKIATISAAYGGLKQADKRNSKSSTRGVKQTF